MCDGVDWNFLVQMIGGGVLALVAFAVGTLLANRVMNQ